MMKIFLDPGHGGRDPGAQANGLQEKDITLVIAQRIESILIKNYERIAVKMSRTTDQTISLRERTNAANRWNASLFLSIHINAGGGKGYEDYIYHKLSDSSHTAKLRGQVHPEIVKFSSMYNRGKKKANFHVLRETTMPALLTECGFIDYINDATKMKQDFWLDYIARGHVNGLVKALGLIKKTKTTHITYIKVIADSLWTYHSPRWADRALLVNKGEIFTVVKGPFKVGNGFMYRLKSGFYITTNRNYVREYHS